jgi:hypothetical protein
MLDENTSTFFDDDFGEATFRNRIQVGRRAAGSSQAIAAKQSKSVSQMRGHTSYDVGGNDELERANSGTFAFYRPREPYGMPSSQQRPSNKPPVTPSIQDRPRSVYFRQSNQKSAFYTPRGREGYLNKYASSEDNADSDKILAAYKARIADVVEASAEAEYAAIHAKYSVAADKYYALEDKYINKTISLQEYTKVAPQIQQEFDSISSKLAAIRAKISMPGLSTKVSQKSAFASPYTIHERLAMNSKQRASMPGEDYMKWFNSHDHGTEEDSEKHTSGIYRYPNPQRRGMYPSTANVPAKTLWQKGVEAFTVVSQAFTGKSNTEHMNKPAVYQDGQHHRMQPRSSHERGLRGISANGVPHAGPVYRGRL